MKNLKVILFTIFSCMAITSCYYEDLDDTEARDLISADSELLQNLIDVSKDPTVDDQAIDCILIVYPISIFSYENGTTSTGLTIMTNNEQFQNFLEVLPATTSISISYPIAATLADGTRIEITTNEELKSSIDTCVEEEEETRVNCQNLIDTCVWKVGYSQTSNNDFLGATFDTDFGATNFEYRMQTTVGSWTAIIIENELFININITGEQEIQNQFNRNWKVEYLDENSLRLTNEMDELILHQYCDVPLDECFNFTFTECEDTSTPGFTEITLDDYSFCIFQILQESETTGDLNYYSTLMDAETDTNQLISSNAFVNTQASTAYYVRLNEIDSEEFYIVEITVNVGTCI